MTANACLRRLEQRRRQLGMSMSALAKRSGVSLPTVQRILSGGHAGASFESIVAISNALGMDTSFQERTTAHEFVRQEAMDKARRLVAVVQGTSGLEGQAVDAEQISTLTDQRCTRSWRDRAENCGRTEEDAARRDAD